MSDEYNAKENCEEYVKDKTAKILKIEKKITSKEKRIHTNERKLSYCRDKRRKRRLEFSIFCCKEDLEDFYMEVRSLKERRDAMKVVLDEMFV
jgi:predicted  nucleic acid-binding Zn-ribbon protein